MAYMYSRVHSIISAIDGEFSKTPAAQQENLRDLYVYRWKRLWEHLQASSKKTGNPVMYRVFMPGEEGKVDQLINVMRGSCLNFVVVEYKACADVQATAHAIFLTDLEILVHQIPTPQQGWKNYIYHK